MCIKGLLLGQPQNKLPHSMTDMDMIEKMPQCHRAAPSEEAGISSDVHPPHRLTMLSLECCGNTHAGIECLRVSSNSLLIPGGEDGDS